MEVGRREQDGGMGQQASIFITDVSRIFEARLAAMQSAQRVGFDEQVCGKVGIVATELASNLTKHAVRGEILTGAAEAAGVPTVEIFALDEGPGIANMADCLRDGYSTAGSPGTGLGAVARLSSSVDVYTHPEKGTAFLATFRKANGKHESSMTRRMTSGAICLPKPGEVVSGDGYAVEHQPERCLSMIVDGLGHGPEAADVAREAIDVFRKRTTLRPGAIIELMHRALRSTRGGAVGVAEIDFNENIVRFAGVGNISGAIVGPNGPRHLVSHNGIVGHDVSHIREFSYPWIKDGILVMHSDGLGTKWNLASYAGLQTRSPGIIAGVLYRDFSRRRDDVTVLVVRATEERA